MSSFVSMNVRKKDARQKRNLFLIALDILCSPHLHQQQRTTTITIDLSTGKNKIKRERNIVPVCRHLFDRLNLQINSIDLLFRWNSPPI